MSDDPLQEFIDKKSERVVEYLAIIDEMLEDPECHYSYAEDTICGIQHYIEEYETITDKQVQAIDNIRSKPSQRNYGR